MYELNTESNKPRIAIRPIDTNVITNYIIAQLLVDTNNVLANPAYTGDYRTLTEGPDEFDVLRQEMRLDGVNNVVFCEGDALFEFVREDQNRERYESLVQEMQYEHRNLFPVRLLMDALKRISGSNYLQFYHMEQRIKEAEKDKSSTEHNASPLQRSMDTSAKTQGLHSRFYFIGDHELPKKFVASSTNKVEALEILRTLEFLAQFEIRRVNENLIEFCFESRNPNFREKSRKVRALFQHDRHLHMFLDAPLLSALTNGEINAIPEQVSDERLQQPKFMDKKKD